MGFKTKEEAIEAWNTWRGRYTDVNPDDLVAINNCNYCSKLTDDTGKYVEPLEQDMVSPVVLHLNGAMILPWPKLSPTQANSPNTSNRHLKEIFALRARWCALFSDVTDYRDKISAMIIENDRENILLNRQLEKWNEYLDSHGFTVFTENDLRGVNLSGLHLGGGDYSGAFLRNIDLSYSELSAAQLNGSNLYGATLCCADCFNANFRYSILSKSQFSFSMLTRSYFCASDLTFASFSESTMLQANLNGAKLNGCKFEKCNISNGTAENHERFVGTEKRTYAIETTDMVVIDSNTQGLTVAENSGFDDKQSTPNSETTNIFQAISKSTEIKPSFLGLSFNIKTFYIEYIAPLFNSKRN